MVGERLAQLHHEQEVRDLVPTINSFLQKPDDLICLVTSHLVK